MCSSANDNTTGLAVGPAQPEQPCPVHSNNHHHSSQHSRSAVGTIRWLNPHRPRAHQLHLKSPHQRPTNMHASWHVGSSEGTDEVPGNVSSRLAAVFVLWDISIIAALVTRVAASHTDFIVEESPEFQTETAANLQAGKMHYSKKCYFCTTIVQDGLPN
jgi:hypothetical protein